MYEPEEMLEAAKFLTTMAQMRQKLKDAQIAAHARRAGEAQAAPSPSDPAPGAERSQESETTVTEAAPTEATTEAPKRRGRPRKSSEPASAAPTANEDVAPPAPSAGLEPQSGELTLRDVIAASDRFKARVGLAQSAGLLKKQFLPAHDLASFAEVRDAPHLWKQFIEFCDTVQA
jgi:hypothetical protein